MKRTKCIIAIFGLALFLPAFSKDKKTEKLEESEKNMISDNFKGMELRNIGPALTSGRIADFAVDPNNRSHYYAAVCSGGVWETRNAGTTWKPIFDTQGSYSIGCITMDPSDPNTLWVGTGENNSQRSVGYGDGIYLSKDGGASWQNMGLKESEHIGKIQVDPRNSQIVFVAAQGPLWREGGERGLYRTKDGGKNWELVLNISKDTGINEVIMDPHNPDTLYASSYQRRRHIWTLIDGGPESTIYKSVDGGDSWFKQAKGLPEGDLGRIGLAVAPTQPDVVYAIVEATEKKSGFFCSTNGGSSWEKRSSYVSSSPQYYQEIFVDPTDSNTIYSLDTYLHRSIDGGRTFKKIGKGSKHVDNHAIWIDPKMNSYILVGCDGGIYESFDNASNWKFISNLPVTQFYRISADNSFPFYFVYGGTQDNFSLGAPSRTTKVSGITNSDWFVTLGGDGYKSQIDPDDPNTIYAQYQYGGLARYDKQSGERVYIQPKPSLESVPLKWNWNTPLIISPHNSRHLYYGSNILFRSTDRGNSWQAVSPDLSRQVNRNELEVMGRIWPEGAIAKNKSTSFYGSMVSLCESELREGLIYAGMDDGLIQVTGDGGTSWARYESFPGIPAWSYVSALVASQHDENRVYAAFDNHKKGDFRPYALVSEDRGRTWTSISGNLPQKGTVYALAEDHISPDLLFAGTEFGVFFSNDRGRKWVQLKSGIPLIAVRDLSIQKRENDLVIASFGRGIFILDNYAPLRELHEGRLSAGDYFCEVKDTWQFIITNPLGYSTQGQQGDGFFTAENPDYGAVFTYFLHEGYTSLKDKRLKTEQDLIKAGKNPGYPSYDDLEIEENEIPWKVTFEISDSNGNSVCRLKGPNTKGVHRVAWNLNYPTTLPVEAPKNQDPDKKDNPFKDQTTGVRATPGLYTVSMFVDRSGKPEQVGTSRRFKVETLGEISDPATNLEELLAFRRSAADLVGALFGWQKIYDETELTLGKIEKVVFEYPEVPFGLSSSVQILKTRLREMDKVIHGDRVIESQNEAVKPGVKERIEFMYTASAESLSVPTQTQKETFDLVKDQFVKALEEMRAIRSEIEEMNRVLEQKGAPWTPGRIPVWPKTK